MNGTERIDTVVVGGGQAGLVTGYYLSQQHRPFVILDANDRIGGGWRSRWDSLRLFTPARFDGLPGLPFPGPKHVAPTKDQMADYLETYAKTMRLPVRSGVRVSRITRAGDAYIVATDQGRIEAANVIIATGAHAHPHVPSFAPKLDPSIVQMHSLDYRNPSQLQPGGVLLVGAGNSGADIAMETIKTHPTWLAGRDVGHVPFHIESRVGRRAVHVVRFVGQHVLTARSPIGRKVMPKLRANGAPLIRIKPKELTAAGVQRVGRVAGIEDGKPVLDDGRVLDVANVIWCTGFRPDWSWIELPITGEDGEPVHQRGVVTDQPGLYFVGLLFQFGATSDVITGVPRDARYVVRHLQSARPATAPARGVMAS